MLTIQQYIESKIQQRKDEDNFRSLKIANGLVDFYSNDYLGFARDAELKNRIEQEINSHPGFFLGSTGSRLLSGNNEYFEELEKNLADFHGAESALIFNSGFDANFGLFSTLPYRGDTVIYDEFVHASIHDGIKKGKANSISFAHNNMDELESRLNSAGGLIYVVVESVYSVDGDFAPLKEISALCEKYNAGLIVDEAHATGTQGMKGEGRIGTEIPEARVLARIHTFSKALGAFGAVILCSHELKSFLVNYCRPLIYSTALPYYSLAAIKCAYQLLDESGHRRNWLLNIIDIFKMQFKEGIGKKILNSDSQIQSLLVSGNDNAKRTAAKIQEHGFDVRAILYPTVPKGKERIRICLHSFNTEEEVLQLTRTINTF